MKANIYQFRDEENNEIYFFKCSPNKVEGVQHKHKMLKNLPKIKGGRVMYRTLIIDNNLIS